MTPEEWLRERGIEVARHQQAAQPGQFAGQHTSALPYFPPQEPEGLTDQETQRVPTVVRIDLHIGGDVAEWPTAALPDPALPLDESSEWHYIDSDANSDADYALEDEMTVPLPIIPPALPPSGPNDSTVIDAIVNTPTRRLE